jgi:molybdate transport system regulatory protein
MAITPSRSISVASAPAASGGSASGGAGHRISLRLDLASGARVGPGKVRLLEEIASSGSSSAAGRALKMSYRRAWELVEDLNRHLGLPVVTTAAGGSGGGGARLTPAGLALVAQYRAIEAASQAAAAAHISELEKAISPNTDP